MLSIRVCRLPSAVIITIGMVLYSGTRPQAHDELASVDPRHHVVDEDQIEQLRLGSHQGIKRIKKRLELAVRKIAQNPGEDHKVGPVVFYNH